MSYAVYRVTAQPGLGGRRVYIGALRIAKWDKGGCPQRAAEARCAAHASGGRCSAAWLRKCTDFEPPTVLHVCMRLEEVLAYELFAAMQEIRPGAPFNLRVRGGPFCEIRVDWPAVEDIARTGLVDSWEACLAGVQGDAFSEWPDVQAHLAGACYRCGGTDHLAAECERQPATARAAPQQAPATPAREPRHAAHYIPLPETAAVYWCDEEGRAGRWRYDVEVQPKGRKRKVERRSLSIRKRADDEWFAETVADGTEGPFNCEDDAIHAGATMAVDLARSVKRRR